MKDEVREAGNIIHVAIIMLNYNTFMDVARLIQSIKKKKLGNIKLHFIVVDNCSQERKDEDCMLKLLQDEDLYIKNTENTGYARGNNKGIQEAIRQGMKYSLILNPDIILMYEESIFEMIKRAELIDDFIIGGPNIIGLKPYLKRPSLLDFIFPFLTPLRKGSKKMNASGVIKAYRIIGSVMLINNLRFAEIGLFDPKTFLFFEENIIGEKVWNSPYACYYMPEICFKHEHSKSIDFSLSRKKYKFFLKSVFIYLHNYRKLSVPLSKTLAANFTFFRVVVNFLLGRK